MNARRYAHLDFRLDRADRTPEGFLQGLVPVTKCGVFQYRNKDGTIRLELRHPDDVHDPKSLESLQLCPAQVEHVAMLDSSNVDQFKVGHLGSAPIVNADKSVSIPIRIDGKKGLDAFAAGKRELSMGYELDLEPAAPGSQYDGEPYTHRQRNIRYNHVAITDRARLGPELRLDSADAVQVDSVTPPKETSAMLKKVNIDSVEYEVPPQVAVAINKLEGRADAAEAAKTQAEKDLEDEKAENTKGMDALKGQVTSLTADLAKARKDAADLEANIPARAAAIAKDRSDSLFVAQAVLSAAELTKATALDSAGIRAAVVKAKYPTIALDGKSVEYIGAMFETVRAGIKQNGTDAFQENRAVTTPIVAEDSANNDGTVVNVDAAREKMIKREQGAYLKPKLV